MSFSLRTAVATIAAAAAVAATAAPTAAVPSRTVDESPTIADSATLKRGVVSADGRSADITFKLRCPRGDRWTASMLVLVVAPGAPDDVTAATGSPAPTGRCLGRPQKVVLTVHAAPVRQWDYSVDPPVLVSETYYPIPRTCGAEYGVHFEGTGWVVAFDRGGADGGPDGPGRKLCLR